MLEEEEIFWLRVDSELPIDEYNIKVGIANAFRMILVESRDWRSSISGLNFDPLPHMESKALEIPFSEEESLATLSSLSGYKVTQTKWFHHGSVVGCL